MANRDGSDTISKETVEGILNRLKENTRTECIRIRTKISGWPLPLTASKFGGVPYWPDMRTYPTARGRRVYMTLLAQINFADLPENGVFPREGILQFFLLDGGWPTECRAAYHECVDDAVSPLPFYGGVEIDPSKRIGDYIPTSLMPEFTAVRTPTGERRILKFSGREFFWKDAGFPVDGELALEFAHDFDCVNVTENRFEDEFRKAAEQLGVALPEEIDAGYSLLSGEDSSVFDEYFDCGHKLLGHPYFVQNDDRDDGDELLLQIDSAPSDSDEVDDRNFITLGDAGVCRFFIPRGDLRRLDFSRVSYDWDCC